MGADGAPSLAPVRDLPPDPPRLCEAGPCRHYHRFQIQLDAQNPMEERKSDGTVIRHGRVFHVQTHHYCYPDTGIELELGALPVLTCNHWVPATSLLRTKRGIRRRFERELAAWQEGQHAWTAETNAAIAADTDAMIGTPITWRVLFEDAPGPPVVVEALTRWTIDEVVAHAAIAARRAPWPFTAAIVASDDPADWAGYREPIDNLTATSEDLELVGGTNIIGERILVTFLPQTTKEIPQ